MVGELAARHALSKEVIDGVTERTGGVPLFIEEVTRLLLERGEQGGAQAIPPTLQQSLAARLDRLGPAREVAQLGAVIGRGFSYALLRAVAGMEDTALQTALERLAEADILLVQGLPPDSDYRFKHALIQDAAYENLLKSRRQILHRRVVEVLRDRFADSAAAEPQLLAHHFTQAGLTEAAIEWWGKAGDQALRRSAFQEAISHFGKAIEMADKERDAAPRPEALSAAAVPSQRLKLQTSYGQALVWAKGFGADETKAAFIRATKIAAGVSDATERFSTYYGLWVSSAVRGEFGFARHTAESFLQEAKTEGRPREAAIANRIMGMTCLHQGEVANARAYLEEALRNYNPEGDSEATIRFAQDHRASASAWLAVTNWVLGEVASGRALMEKALARAVECAHVPTLVNIALIKALLEILRGDAEAARGTAERVVGLAQEHGLTFVLGGLMMCSGWARAQLGDFEVGAAELRRALASYRDQGNRIWVPIFRGLLAEIEARGQAAEAALMRIDEALVFAGESEEHWSDSFLHRVRGEILLKRDPTDTGPAEEAFLSAMAIAQQQKVKSFELRAARSLAKLCQSTGRAADAHAVLVLALEGFLPTPEFPEIEKARRLLTTLK
jgi:predicted ATPase